MENVNVVPCEVVLLDHMGSDLSVVNAARVSFAKFSNIITDGDKKLISFLAKNGHWSPFAHCSIQFRIKAPIFVARQLVKHQVGLSWNETSRRYVDSPPEFFFPDIWRTRALDKKQGSGEDISEQLQKECFTILENVTDLCLNKYNYLLEIGVAPEQARIVLPLNSMTEWWWTGSLYAFARICKERLAPDAQQETKDVAKKISEEMAKIFPISWETLTH